MGAPPQPKRKCSVEGCDGVVKARKLCNKHYARYLRTGRAEENRQGLRDFLVEKGGKCAVTGCERPRRTREWCTLHYGRWYRHGNPLAVSRRGPKFKRADPVVEGRLQALIDRLTEERMSARCIGEALGIASRTVQRYRAMARKDKDE